MKQIYFIAITLLAFCAHANAQDYEPLENYRGSVQYKHYPIGVDGVNYPLTKAEEQAANATLNEIATYLEQTEGVKNPVGVEIIFSTQLEELPRYTPLQKQIPGSVTMSFYPWYKSNGVAKYKCGECVAGFSLFVNNLQPLLVESIGTGFDVYDDDGAPVFLKPGIIKSQSGVTFYDNRTIVITKSGEPLFKQLTVRQYDNILLKRLEKLMNEEKAPEDKMMRKFFLDKLKEEMAGFTDEELDKPAYEYAFGASPVQNEGAKQIVKINKAYFNASVPRTKAQIIIFEIAGLQSDPDNLYFEDEYSSFQNKKENEVLRKLNFAGLRNLLNEK